MLSALVIAQLCTLGPPRSDGGGPPQVDEAAPEAAPQTETPTVGALPLRIEAELSEPDRAEISGRFTGGLERSGFDLQAVEGEDAATCAAADCYQALAKKNEVSQLAVASVSRDGPDYNVKASIVSGETGEVIAEVDGVCEICGVQELGDMVEGLVARLRTKAAAAFGPTRLTVDSDPQGATVKIDGNEVGQTPLTIEVDPGPHEIEVHRDGFRSEKTQAELRPGVAEQFSYNLARNKANIPVWLPWTALGVGVGALGAGVALIAIDERPIKRDCNEDAAGNCEFLHDTLPGGIALTVTGAALIGTGIALAIVRQRRQSSSNVSASAWLGGGAGLTIRGRF